MNAATGSIHSRPTGSRVHYRRMQFSFDRAGFARYWHDGSPFKSYFWTQLSTAFEPGERFLMDAARAMRERLSDAGLEAELLEFLKQESHHIAQHLRFDAKNAEHGVDVEGCRERYKRALLHMTRDFDARKKLSFTVAGEHFTAILAHLLLTRPELMKGADPGVAALWIWHAVEEAEHKATCFDIFLSIHGTYLERIRVMPPALWFFLRNSLVNSALLLHRDGQLFKLRTLRELPYLLSLLARFTPGLLSYLRPDFHPSEFDHSGLIAAWQAENQGNIRN